MKVSELKKILEPMIKKSVREAILEDGILSQIIKESIVGAISANSLLNEQKKEPSSNYNIGLGNTNISELKKEKGIANTFADEESVERYNKQLKARRKLLDSIGRDKMGGVDIFEGTTPIPSVGPQHSPLHGQEASDKGVDITQLPGMKNWSKLVNGN